MSRPNHAHDDGSRSPDWAARMHRLNDPARLERSLSEADLTRLLALRGDESVLDLGSGTGFYTDRIATLTAGTVYALEIVPEMLRHYRERGLPKNVRLSQGDITALAPGAANSDYEHGLAPSSIDVAITIATWHEIDGRLDVPGLVRLLSPNGRLIVVDWRKGPDTWDYGPPEEMRFTTAEVIDTLAPHFTPLRVEDVGPSMFAVTARLA